MSKGRRKSKSRKPVSSAQSRQQILQDALALHQTGRIGKAIRLYEKYLASSKNDINAIANPATALKQAGRVDEALSRFNEAVQLDSKRPEIWFNLANTYRGRAMIESCV